MSHETQERQTLAEGVPTAAYERAERMLGHNRRQLALRAEVTPRWIDDGTRFWYKVDTELGTEFVLVDPAAGSRRPAFNHERLAQALADASAEAVEPYDLPFHAIRFTGDSIGFEAFGAHWTCLLSDYSCARDGAARKLAALEVGSPDGQWVAFRRNDDLWLRSADNGDEFALTTDGTAERSYAAQFDQIVDIRLLRRCGVPEPPPALLWSPDSTRIVTHLTDQSGVAMMHLVESMPPDEGRPRLHSFHYAMPGETQARGEWVCFDVASRTPVRALTEPFQMPYPMPMKNKAVWWSVDSATAYYLEQTRDRHTLSLKAIDAATGEVRTLIEERGQSRVEPAQNNLQKPMVRVLTGGREALWYSQRDGWGHLYLYDLDTGRLTRQVTAGNWAVQEIVLVDETERVAFVLASGLVASDPYRRTFVSVGLDDGSLTRHTDDELDHVVRVPEHGRWFVDSASTVDTPPVTTVRGLDGKVLIELERADVSRLVEAGWTPPERICTTAADGVTPVYGLLYKPYGFDPQQQYPIVDNIYPGPQVCRVLPSFDQLFMFGEAEAMAALGFVVVAVDGRGTPGRDKAFHDYSYRNLGAAGALEDHVAAVRQLAETRPWMDLDRVGMFGSSGGGFATARALLRYPEIYKVGVASCGNQDNRFYGSTWAERFDGPYDPADPEMPARLSNTELPPELAGRLLLIHGEMDQNVTPFLTMRLVDRLIAANQDFDLLIVPGANHGFFGYEAYVHRRRWDYFVRHLMNREPPAYRIADVPFTAEQRAAALS